MVYVRATLTDGKIEQGEDKKIGMNDGKSQPVASLFLKKGEP